MNNKLIIQLIKNNIEEIQNLINHFQHEENDLKDGFPLLESRLLSLNNDINILKLNINNHSTPNPDTISEEAISTDELQTILKEDNLINEESNDQINEKDIATISSTPGQKEMEILAPIEEKFEINVSTLNDKLQAERGGNLQEKIQRSKLVDIQTAIGINDQFLFIRELFNNKPEDYKSAIQYINNQADYDKIVTHFNQTRKWDKDDNSVIQFFDLIKRKFE
ncbi:hypothetical protein EO244_02225 [Ancylomarina salipaludis]|uniref:Uncharacterized protein n=1 Tax=Ancylomarina salipaludis TaxID=2501299 RepID=A0A4Q1JS33_9BACT|nr:hypothetical protein [Ancylomarina salipaludis]RXQ97721.1 hypothetical protein EO244_02225 [Ancylomarina salipaludis]